MQLNLNTALTVTITPFMSVLYFVIIIIIIIVRIS